MSSQLDLLPRRSASAFAGRMGWPFALLSAAARFLGFALYAVLAMFEPLVRLVLLLLALGGLVTCGVYRFLLQDPHFPLWTMLTFSISMCVLWGLYAALLRALPRG